MNRGLMIAALFLLMSGCATYNTPDQTNRLDPNKDIGREQGIVYQDFGGGVPGPGRRITHNTTGSTAPISSGTFGDSIPHRKGTPDARDAGERGMLLPWGIGPTVSTKQTSPARSSMDISPEMLVIGNTIFMVQETNSTEQNFNDAIQRMNEEQAKRVYIVSSNEAKQAMRRVAERMNENARSVNTNEILKDLTLVLQQALPLRAEHEGGSR